MSGQYEGLNATARRREQEEDAQDAWDDMYDAVKRNKLDSWLADGCEESEFEISNEAIHAEVVARMKAAKDAAQD